MLFPAKAASLSQPATEEHEYLSKAIKFQRAVSKVKSRHLLCPHLALPPVGWQRTVEQPEQSTTVWAALNTVVILQRKHYKRLCLNEEGHCRSH